MTDEAKALVERIKGRLLQASINNRAYERPMDWTEADNLIDLIETQARDIERLREALGWALAEIEGRTRYQTNTVYTAAEQRQNALDCARAALAGDSHDQ